MKKICSLVVSFVTVLSVSLPASAGPKQGQIHKIPLDKQEKTTETKAALAIGVTPIMPRSAKRSGFCCMLVDVSELGLPEKVDIEYCTGSYYKRPSITAVKKWKFNPANIDGLPVKTKQQSFIVSYVLTNRQRKIVVDKKHLMIHNGEMDFSIKRLCGKVPVS